MPRIIPIRNLKGTAFISRTCHESKEPIFVTKNGYGDMVIMSQKSYEERLALPDVYMKLAEAEEQLEAGKTVDPFETIKSLRSRYGL